MIRWWKEPRRPLAVVGHQAVPLEMLVHGPVEAVRHDDPPLPLRLGRPRLSDADEPRLQIDVLEPQLARLGRATKRRGARLGER